jgi:hypothetical protein
MTIETRTKEILKKLDDFKKNGIRTDIKEVCHFQDLIGTADYKTIFEIYESFDQPNRRTFIWACCCTLSAESCEEIIKQTTIRIQRKAMMVEFEEWMEERSVILDKRESEIAEREQVFDKCKKSYWRRIRELKDERSDLTRGHRHLRKANEDLCQENIRLRREVYKMFKLNKLKNILRELVKED